MGSNPRLFDEDEYAEDLPMHDHSFRSTRRPRKVNPKAKKVRPEDLLPASLRLPSLLSEEAWTD